MVQLDDKWIADSDVITQILEDKYPEPPLATPPHKAEVYVLLQLHPTASMQCLRVQIKMLILYCDPMRVLCLKFPNCLSLQQIMSDLFDTIQQSGLEFLKMFRTSNFNSYVVQILDND